jgi:hypothetical protein
LEQRGVDCDCDLAFNYKDAAPGTSAVLSGMLCFSQKSLERRNPWATTRLAQGNIFEIAAPRIQDMVLPFDTDNFAFEAREKEGETRQEGQEVFFAFQTERRKAFPKGEQRSGCQT